MTQQALIIENDLYSAEVLQTLLKRSGIDSVTILDGRKVAEMLSKQPDFRPCIIFLDLEFPTPVINGFDIFQQLRAEERFDGVPIVACSVHIGQIESVRQAGFDSFIGKPLKLEEFDAQVKRILNHGAVWQTGAE